MASNNAKMNPEQQINRKDEFMRRIYFDTRYLVGTSCIKSPSRISQYSDIVNNVIKFIGR